VRRLLTHCAIRKEGESRLGRKRKMLMDVNCKWENFDKGPKKNNFINRWDQSFSKNFTEV
jgi:hypothetical protein